MPEVHFVELNAQEAGALVSALRNAGTTLATRFGDRDLARKELLKSAREKVHELFVGINSGREPDPGEVKLDDEELVEALAAVLEEQNRIPDPDNEDSKATVEVLDSVGQKLDKAVAGFVNLPQNRRSTMAGNPSSGIRDRRAFPVSDPDAPGNSPQ